MDQPKKGIQNDEVEIKVKTNTLPTQNTEFVTPTKADEVKIDCDKIDSLPDEKNIEQSESKKKEVKSKSVP